MKKEKNLLNLQQKKVKRQHSEKEILIGNQNLILSIHIPIKI
jgi:hypothetical protein